jgi:hypothetical protein
VLLHLARKEMDRQAAHVIVQRNAMQMYEEGMGFREPLLKDENLRYVSWADLPDGHLFSYITPPVQLIEPRARRVARCPRRALSLGRLPVTSDNPLSDAVLLLLEYLQNSHSDKERQFLEVAGGASAFLSVTGQLYRFEDFRESTKSSHVKSLSFADIIRYLERKAAQASSAEEKRSLHAAIDALAFIDSSGQHEGLEDYLSYWRSSTLPPVIAVFKTREEADTWLEGQFVPPYMARVLIGDEYHAVLATRESRDLPFVPMSVVAEFIETQSRTGLPPVVAAFDTREQAEAWFASIPEPPRHAFLTIKGAHYVAAYWKNLNHRALYPFTLVEELVKERLARMQRLGLAE